MDENKNFDKEIMQNRMKIIFSSIAEVILVFMEFYIMINFSNSFLTMLIVALCMVVALFYLVTGVFELTMLLKQVDRRDFEELYKAQKASYLVIRKSFDEMDDRLRQIEENSALPAEEIINAQKAVAKVTISRNKENTDALMNSNDELINQLFSFQEQLTGNNDQLLSKQQEIMDATKADILANNGDLQAQLDALQKQMAQMEQKIAAGAVAATAPVDIPPIQVEIPPIIVPDTVYETEPILESLVEQETIEPEVVEEELQVPDDFEIPVETVDETVDAVGVEEPVEEVDDLAGVDVDALLSSLGETTEAMEGGEIDAPSVDDLLADIGVPLEETPLEELPLEETPIDETLIEETSIDGLLDEISVDVASEDALDEIPLETIPGLDEDVVEEQVAIEEPVVAEEPIAVEEPVAVEEPAPVEEPVAVEEPAPVEIPDVGIDLSDPNRQLTAEEIEKLFASM